MKLRKGYLKLFGFVEADIFQAAFIDGIFEWQLAENEVSAKLKRSFNEVEKQPAHWFVLNEWFGDGRIGRIDI